MLLWLLLLWLERVWRLPVCGARLWQVQELSQQLAATACATSCTQRRNLVDAQVLPAQEACLRQLNHTP